MADNKSKTDAVESTTEVAVVEAQASNGTLTAHEKIANAQGGDVSLWSTIQGDDHAARVEVLKAITTAEPLRDNLDKTINLVKKRINPNLKIEGVVLTMYDGRTNLSAQVVQEVIKFFPDKVHQVIIPRNVRLGEAPSHGMPITKFDPKCAGSISYQKLADEIAGGMKK